MSVFVSVVVSPVFADDVKSDPRENLETAVPEAIRLLEAKEYEVFLESFTPPVVLKKIKAGEDPRMPPQITTITDITFEEFARRFGERKAPTLLKVLKEIKNAKPTLDDTGTKATFALNEEINERKSLTFVKIKKHWYIQN